MLPTRARYSMLGFALGTMALAYIDRVAISMSSAAIQRDLALSDEQLGYAFSAFTLAYALFEVPSGWLADRFGARRMMARIVLWWSAFTAATAAARGFFSLVGIRFLFGMGEAGVLPTLASAFRRWLPDRERGRAFGLTVAAGALGSAISQPIVGAMLERFTWRETFVAFGVLGAGWAGVWYWWMRDDPREHASVNAAEVAQIGPPAHEEHQGVPWRRLLRSRNLIVICAMYFCAIYGWYFFMTWLPQYLARARGFDIREIGWLASLPWIAIAAGCFFGGLLSDHLVRTRGRRVGLRVPGIVGLPIASLMIVGAILTASAAWATAFLTAAAGFAALGIASAWSTCLAIGGRHGGVVSGAMNMFGNLGGTVCPVVFGQSLQHLGSWNLPLASVAVLYAVSGAMWLAVDPEVSLDAEAELSRTGR
jgi:ACS family glucarate transporter-like MFS transporter